MEKGGGRWKTNGKIKMGVKENGILVGFDGILDLRVENGGFL